MERTYNFIQWLFHGFFRRFWIGFHAIGWFYVSVIVLAHLLLEGTIASGPGLMIILASMVIGSAVGALTAKVEEGDPDQQVNRKEF